MRHAFSAFLALAAFVLFSAPSGAQPEKKTEESKKTSAMVGGKTLDQWIDDLKNKDPAKRELALSMIKLYGSGARPAVPAVIRTMGDPDMALRVNAIIALGFIGMNNEHVNTGVTALTRALGDNQGIVRYQAAMALGRLGVDAKSAIPALLNTVSDKASWEIRQAGAFALGTVAVDKKAAPEMRVIKALLGALRDSSYQVRLESVLSLITLGPPGTPADKNYTVTELEQLVRNDSSMAVKIWARMAVMRMDKVTDTHVKAIGAQLKNSDPEVRVHAARALATIGPEAKGQISNLMAQLDDKDLQVVYWVIVALAQMGDAAMPALSALEKFKGDKDEAIRRAAEEAIEKIKAKKK
jgi:HEAT repeat protein